MFKHRGNKRHFHKLHPALCEHCAINWHSVYQFCLPHSPLQAIPPTPFICCAGNTLGFCTEHLRQNQEKSRTPPRVHRRRHAFVCSIFTLPTQFFDDQSMKSHKSPPGLLRFSRSNTASISVPKLRHTLPGTETINPFLPCQGTRIKIHKVSQKLWDKIRENHRKQFLKGFCRNVTKDEATVAGLAAFGIFTDTLQICDGGVERAPVTSERRCT